MPDLLPLSVHTLTRNSGKSLRRTLESLPPCREILLVDGGSRDDTLAIAAAFHARVIPQKPLSDAKIPDFAQLRNLALQVTTQPWILIQDSDEELSPALREEIASVVRTAEPAAYLVPRHYVDADGTEIFHASTYPNERIFFFHASVADRWIKPVHERILLKPNTSVKRLRHPSLAPLPTPEEFKEKNLRYIAVEAAASRGKGWGNWLRHRLLHTCRSRIIATVRLAMIWLWPHKGKRLPLQHELLRYWYAWRLVIATCPASQRNA